jgi:hypothetical protein
LKTGWKLLATITAISAPIIQIRAKELPDQTADFEIVAALLSHLSQNDRSADKIAFYRRTQTGLIASSRTAFKAYITDCKLAAIASPASYYSGWPERTPNTLTANWICRDKAEETVAAFYIVKGSVRRISFGTPVGLQQ